MYYTPHAGIAQLVEHNLAKVGVGSSSLLSRSNFFYSVFYLKNWTDSAGIAQLVEHNLAKVGVGSSSLLSRSKIFYSVFYLKNWTDSAGIAQLVEHNLAKVGVGSSSLLSRSKFKKPSSKDGGFFIDSIQSLLNYIVKPFNFSYSNERIFEIINP